MTGFQIRRQLLIRDAPAGTLPVKYVPRSVIQVTLLSAIAACGGDGGGGSSSGDSIADTISSVPPPPSLPPDPGAAGLQTIEGVDSDADGVRDDLQIYLANRFGDADVDRRALRQITIDLQDQLAPNQTESDYVATATRLHRSIGCYVFGESDLQPEQRATEISALQAKVVNTRERQDAYRSFDAAVGGQVFASLSIDQQSDACTSDVD